MALTLKLSRTGINNTGTEMYISDVTGIYSEDNKGGWGTPNTERALVMLAVQAIYHASTGDEDVEIVPYDPETTEGVTINTSKDGYYDIIAVAVSKTAPTVEGAYGWSGGVVQMVDGTLVAKTPEDLLKDPLFLEAVSFKTILLARLTIYRNRTNLNLVRLKQSKNDDRSHNREISDKEEHFSFVRGLLEGARYLWCLDSYVDAQLLVESFNELLENGN